MAFKLFFFFFALLKDMAPQTWYQGARPGIYYTGLRCKDLSCWVTQPSWPKSLLKKKM